MMDQQQMWTLVIAVGGLVIAVIALGWNVYFHAASRPKIKVTATIMQMYPPPRGLSEDTDILVLEAVNLRSRPVTVKGFSGTFCKPGNDGKLHFWIKGSSIEFERYASVLPLQIKEGEAARLMSLADHLADISNVKFFFASDTTGRDWYSRKHPLRSQLEKRERDEQ